MLHLGLMSHHISLFQRSQAAQLPLYAEEICGVSAVCLIFILSALNFECFHFTVSFSTRVNLNQSTPNLQSAPRSSPAIYQLVAERGNKFCSLENNFKINMRSGRTGLYGDHSGTVTVLIISQFISRILFISNS